MCLAVLDVVVDQSAAESQRSTLVEKLWELLRVLWRLPIKLAEGRNCHLIDGCVCCGLLRAGLVLVMPEKRFAVADALEEVGFLLRCQNAWSGSVGVWLRRPACRCSFSLSGIGACSVVVDTRARVET